MNVKASVTRDEKKPDSEISTKTLNFSFKRIDKRLLIFEALINSTTSTSGNDVSPFPTLFERSIIGI